MKLISIKISNLASITDANIDFEKAPLEQAGLFAITGDTGAGKSTLLDAICLALYGKTARLKSDEKQTVTFNGDDIKLNDPRNLLRRGCVHGCAEVVFEGQDEQRYLARWHVARARKKITGQLKRADHELIRLSDEVLLAQKSATVKQVEQLVGLSFDQFTRAVLLAQHEFAAFLKASSDERAQLLECLTATDKFSRLGQLIFEKHKEKKLELEQLQHSLNAYSLLSDDELAAVEDAIKAADDKRQALKQEADKLQVAVQWLQQGEKLTLQINELEQSLKTQALQLEAQADEVEQAEQAKLCLQIADNRAQWQKESTQFESLNNKLASLVKQDWQSQINAKQNLLIEAQAQLSTKQQELEQNQPVVATVRSLDTQRFAQQSQITSLQAQLTQTQSKHQDVESQTQQAKAALEHGQQQIVQLKAQLDASGELAPAVENWSHLQALLTNLGQLKSSISSNTRAQVEQQNVADALHAKLSPLNAQLEQQHQAITHLSAQISQSQQQLEGADLTHLQSQQQQYQLAITKHTQLEELAHQQLQLQTSITTNSQRKGVLQTQIQDTQQQSELSKQRVQVTQNSLNQVQLRASESVSSLRAQLRPGQECMVCGATEHPYGVEQIDEHWQTLLQDFALQHQQAEQAHEQALERKRQLVAELDKVNAQLQVDMQQQSNCHNKHDTLHAELAQLPVTIGLNLSQCQNRLETVASQLQSYQHTSNQLQQQFQAQQEAQAQYQQTQSQLAQLKQDAESTQQQLVYLQSQQQSWLEESQHIIEQAKAYYQDEQWWGAFEADANGAYQQLASKVIEYQNLVAALQKSGDEQANLESLLAQHQKLSQEISSQMGTQQVSLQSAQSALTKLDAQRAEVLPLTTSADDWLSQLQKAVSGCQEICASLNQQLNELNQHKNQHALELKHTEEQVQVCSDTLKQLSARFEQWLTTQQETYVNLSEARVIQLLSMPQSDWQQTLQVHQQLTDSITQLKGQLSHIKNEQVAHLDQNITDSNLPQLQQALAELSAQQEQVQQVWLSESTKLKQHQANVEALAQQQAQLSQLQSRYEHWHLLNDLLGDATGKKLRNIAQTQTLQILLQYANQHLQALTARYRLTVIGQSLNIAIIDRDMADEQRSVNTLSGGESFLVSLALALGLASLSSNKVKISSLFIDEGFGTLDPETLSVALDALDALQSQGRKVGVISHVSEMTERVATQIHVKKQSGGYSDVTIKEV